MNEKDKTGTELPDMNLSDLFYSESFLKSAGEKASLNNSGDPNLHRFPPAAGEVLLDFGASFMELQFRIFGLGLSFLEHF